LCRFERLLLGCRAFFGSDARVVFGARMGFGGVFGCFDLRHPRFGLRERLVFRAFARACRGFGLFFGLLTHRDVGGCAFFGLGPL
jgi:hypothetical protein